MTSKINDLLIAVVDGDAAAAGELLNRDNVNFMDHRFNLTLLSWAVTKGHRDVAELLLRMGADPNIHDEAGFQAIHRAAFRDDIEMVELLLANGASAGAPTRNAEGATPLILACIGGKLDTVKYLVSKIHVEVEQKDGQGRKPLEHASENGHNEIVDYLLLSGADPHEARLHCDQYAEAAKTVKQRDNYCAISRALCLEWAPQSMVSV